jgi:hypothetical protein
MQKFTTAIAATTGALAVAALGLASTAGAVGGPGGYGNAHRYRGTAERQRQFSRGHYRPDKAHHRLGRHILQGRITPAWEGNHDPDGPVVPYAAGCDPSVARIQRWLPLHYPVKASLTLGRSLDVSRSHTS